MNNRSIYLRGCVDDRRKNEAVRPRQHISLALPGCVRRGYGTSRGCTDGRIFAATCASWDPGSCIDGAGSVSSKTSSIGRWRCGAKARGRLPFNTRDFAGWMLLFGIGIAVAFSANSALACASSRRLEILAWILPARHRRQYRGLTTPLHPAGSARHTIAFIQLRSPLRSYFMRLVEFH